MTFILETESHGHVEAGFLSILNRYSRIGEYTLITKHLCGLARNLAEHSELRDTEILIYDQDKFWQKYEDYANELVIKQGGGIEERIGNPGEPSLEDDLNLSKEGNMVSVKVGDDESSITIGDYRIPNLEFRRLSLYLAQGGFLGWMDGKNPEFSEPTLKAIRNSTRRLYRKVREEMNQQL